MTLTNNYLPGNISQYFGVTPHELIGLTILPDGKIISDHAALMRIQFLNIEVTEIHNFTLKPDGTLINVFVAQIKMVVDVELSWLS